jgi:hypothetical protein
LRDPFLRDRRPFPKQLREGQLLRSGSFHAWQVLCAESRHPKKPPPDSPFDIDTFEPIDPPWTAIREWNPAANTESLLKRQEAGVPYLALTRRSGA